MVFKLVFLLTLLGLSFAGPPPSVGDSVSESAKTSSVQVVKADEGVAQGAEEQSGCRCRFYRDCNYSGASKCFNTAAGYVGGFENDQFSSVRVAQGWRCVAYEHTNFRGRAVSFYANDRCFTNNRHSHVFLWVWRNWNDRISSVRVYPYNPCRCRLYEHCSYRGYSKCYQSNAAYLGSHNDKYSSIRVAPGYKCTLHEHHNFHGKSHTWTSSDSCFTDNTLSGALWWRKSWNDKASSISVNRNHTVGLFAKIMAKEQSSGVIYGIAGVGILSFAGLAVFAYKKRRKYNEYTSLLESEQV